jgi:hypothetical protein
MMKNAITTLVAALLFAMVIAGGASAQQYQQWNNPDQQAAADKAAADTRLQDIVDRLNALIDKAGKSRAADPQFLRDLRDLAQGYDRPWRIQLLSDDFKDGDYTRGPQWTVTAGKYWIENGWGLRSAVKTEAAPAPEQKPLSGKEAVGAIFGQILQQALDPEGRSSGGGSTSTVINATAIQTRLTMTNAFAIDVEFYSGAAQGRLEIGPYQGTPSGGDRAQGYALAYAPGGELELLRVSGRGTSVIDRAQAPVKLEDKKFHRLEWTRRQDGAMSVAIDGKEILAATDLGFQDNFDGLRMVNRGGDYIFKQLNVYGTR